MFAESIRGCYPRNQTLPGLSGSLIPPRAKCKFLPKRRSPVKVSIERTKRWKRRLCKHFFLCPFCFQVCMCTTQLCNDDDYDFHRDRANILFKKKEDSPNEQSNSPIIYLTLNNATTDLEVDPLEAQPSALFPQQRKPRQTNFRRQQQGSNLRQERLLFPQFSHQQIIN